MMSNDIKISDIPKTNNPDGLNVVGYTTLQGGTNETYTIDLGNAISEHKSRYEVIIKSIYAPNILNEEGDSHLHNTCGPLNVKYKIVNFDESLLDASKYRMCLMLRKKRVKKGFQWRCPMLGSINYKGGNPTYPPLPLAHTYWTITKDAATNEGQLFWNGNYLFRDVLRVNIHNGRSQNSQVIPKFIQSNLYSREIGCAIYMFDGSSWTRISNIAKFVIRPTYPPASNVAINLNGFTSTIL